MAHRLPLPPVAVVLLRSGARVAVVDCGRGELVIALATAFPSSVIAGFGSRVDDIAAGRRAAAACGVSDRITLEVTEPGELRGSGYDLICRRMSAK